MNKERIEKVKNHIKENYEDIQSLKNDLKSVNDIFYRLVESGFFLVYNTDITAFLLDCGYKIYVDDMANFRKYSRVLEKAYKEMVVDSLFVEGGTLA